MRKGYRYCLAGAIDGDIEALNYVPLLVVRGIRYAGLQILNYAFAQAGGGRPSVRELHDWYGFAEARGNAGYEVRDSLYGTIAYPRPQPPTCVRCSLPRPSPTGRLLWN